MKKSFIISLLISLGVFFGLSPVFIHLISYLHPIVLTVILFCIILMVFFLVLLIKQETITLPYRLFLGTLILYTIALLILLFFRPNDQGYNSMNLIPFSTITFYLSGKVNGLISFYNLAANIGLFIPYGFYLRLKRYSNWKLFFIPLIPIAFIEILQFLTHRGSLDIDDLILNLLGVFLGYFFYPIFIRIIKVI